MGFKTTTKGVNDPNAQQKVHPIWRAVGCFMALLIPVIAFTGALMLIEANQEQHWVTIPYDFVAQGKDPYLYVKIGLTAVISFVLYVIFMMITFFVNSAFGPKNYSPFDAPQQKFTGRRYKR